MQHECSPRARNFDGVTQEIRNGSQYTCKRRKITDTPSRKVVVKRAVRGSSTDRCNYCGTRQKYMKVKINRSQIASHTEKKFERQRKVTKKKGKKKDKREELKERNRSDLKIPESSHRERDSPAIRRHK